MKTICAWCNKVLIEGDIRDGILSHGICPDCLKGLIGNPEVSLAELLNSIEFPVLVTSKSVAIQQMNRTAERILGRSLADRAGLKIGAAIECLHAGMPGGCGGSEYCEGCVMRNTITETHEDGQPRYGVYSEHELLAAEGARARRFRFSATKAGEAVLLVIEEIRDLPLAS
jgi:PAS domain-containing protein